MKRILMMLLLVMATIGANAQTIYVCTGNNVLVRTGPGKNYPIQEGFTNFYQTKKRNGRLCKGDIVDGGVRKNGYISVYNLGGGNGDYNIGWVSAQYLKRACSRCQNTDWFKKLGDSYIPACRTCGRRSFSDSEEYSGSYY